MRGLVYEPDEPATHRDPARSRELDGVAEEIDEDLTQMSGIGADARKRRTDGQRQAQPLLVDQRLDLTRDVEHEWTKVERLRVHFESAGCDLRKVENLVDEVAQMIRRGLDALDRPDLARTELTVDTVAQQVH